MDPTFEQMTPAERILYVQDLWDRIAEHPEDVEVGEAWKAELDRRLAAHQADPDAAIPWEQVKANLLARR
jgi:putative addiction module component (TIGR02574 family)